MTDETEGGQQRPDEAHVPASADYDSSVSPSEDARPDVAAPDGPIEAAVGVVTEPVTTLRQLVAHPNVRWAVIVTVVVGALAGVATGATGGGGGELGTDPDLGVARGLGVIGGLIGGPILNLAFLAAWSGIVLGMGRMLGGRAAYRELFTAIGFSYVPSVLSAPAQLLALTGSTGEVVAGIVSFAITMWALVLSVIAVREAHRFSTGRAVATVLVPLLALVVVLGLLFAAVFVALFSGA